MTRRTDIRVRRQRAVARTAGMRRQGVAGKVWGMEDGIVARAGTGNAGTGNAGTGSAGTGSEGAAKSVQLASTSVEEAPTVMTPAPRTSPRPTSPRLTSPRVTSPRVTSPRLEWQIGRSHRLRARLARRLRQRSKRWPWITGGTIAALLVLLLPTLLAFASVMGDYSDIRALGQSGLHHLLAAKDDLASLGALGQSLGVSGGSGTAADAPYSLVVQRQAGTFNSAQVSIQPSAKLRKSGIKPVSASATISANTPFAIGAPPTPAPTPTPKPTATPKSTATPAAGKTATPAIALPDPQSLRDAENDCQLAQHDFQTLQSRLDHLGWALSLLSGLPPVSSQLDTARALAAIGVDAANLGTLYSGALTPLLVKLHGKSLSGNQALLSQSDITGLQKTIAQSQPIFDSLQTSLSGVSIDSLPLSDAQKAEFSAVKTELPKLRDGLSQAGQWISALGWLLGTDATRHFLVQTLDRAELRASGGFAGDFGILGIRNGQVLPFSLTTVERTDYSYGKWYDGWDYRQRPPAAYSWWPIANWGLRDANLSADFPTNAKLIMGVWSNECGAACQAAGSPQHLDGVINITPTAIADMLKVTGPLVIPLYGETITAANLEAKLHYYQLDPAGIAKQLALSPNEDQTSARKAFTHLVAQLLEERVKHLPQSELLPMARQMFADIQAKNLQIYVTNTTVENLLLKEHAGGAIETARGTDSFLVVQTNVSAAKATPCVTTTERDSVTLDDKGGATHHLTVSMYHVTGACDPYPGEFSTYHAYMRIYAPATAQLQSADGFDQNTVLCSSKCPANPYPNGELVCQPGGYNMGVHTNNILPLGANAGVLDNLGGPTQTTSDVPGTRLWGGFVAIPPYCTANLTLSWYVPGVVR